MVGDNPMVSLSEGKKKTRLRLVLDLLRSIAVGIVMAFIVLLIWRDYEKQVERTAENKLNITGQFISNSLNGVITQNIRTLQNLKSRIEVTDGDYFDFWGHDANLILEQNPSFVFVEWIDSNMIIQRIEPMPGNEAALGLDVSKVGYRTAKWQRSARDSSINVTNWAKLTQRGYAFLVDAPVYYLGRFQGTITAGMDFTSIIDGIMSSQEMYNLTLRDDKGVVFYESTMNEEEEDPMVFETSIPISVRDGQYWEMTLTPNASFYEYNEFFENRIGLILGMIVAVIMGIATFFILKSSRESKRIKQINKKLNGVNQALAEEKRKAQEASRIKTEFLSNMSHEIRTPLNAIIGLISIMQWEEEDAEQRRKYLEMMEFSSKNLLSLVNDVLEIEKVESGTIDLKLEVFSPLKVLQDLLDLYESGFHEKNIYLKREISGSAGVEVISDPVKLGQVITNLIRNAYKFTHEGGVSVLVEQEVSEKAVNLTISIIDTGIGMSAESLRHIFERFSQVDTGLKRKYEGTGLGLTITKQIVDALGGTIEVESELGKGSTFRVNLMLPRAGQGDAVVSYGQKEVTYSGGLVLIAEDNPMNVMVLTKLLENFDLKIDVVSNGKEAVAAARKKRYDLIFMDIHMPEMDGIEAAQRIRKKGITSPIVAISANVTHKAVRDSLHAGMKEYITKPYTREVLERVLERYLAVHDHKKK